VLNILPILPIFSIGGLRLRLAIDIVGFVGMTVEVRQLLFCVDIRHDRCRVESTMGRTSVRAAVDNRGGGGGERQIHETLGRVRLPLDATPIWGSG